MKMNMWCWLPHILDMCLTKKKMCKIGKDLTFKIGQYFSLKDVTPREIKANVIYKFTGSCDKSITYIGKTIRYLAIKSKEHLETNLTIFDHSKTCQNRQNSNVENFQILSTGNSDKDAALLWQKEATDIFVYFDLLA